MATALFAIGIVATGSVAIGLTVAGGARAVGAWVPYPEVFSVTQSHYTEANVPSFLKSLEPLLNVCMEFDRHVFTAILPVYFLVVFALGYLKHRESRRVASAENWLIDD